MCTRAFDKRMHFVASATNYGLDTKEANEWYCQLSRKRRKEVPNSDLLASFCQFCINIRETKARRAAWAAEDFKIEDEVIARKTSSSKPLRAKVVNVSSTGCACIIPFLQKGSQGKPCWTGLWFSVKKKK